MRMSSYVQVHANFALERCKLWHAEAPTSQRSTPALSGLYIRHDQYSVGSDLTARRVPLRTAGAQVSSDEVCVELATKNRVSGIDRFGSARLSPRARMLLRRVAGVCL